MNKHRIPKGIYCYDENGNCPYWSIDKSLPEQENGYCAYLKQSDWDINEEVNNKILMSANPSKDLTDLNILLSETNKKEITLPYRRA